MPVGQEILDVRSSGVHDAKARDVDGAILDHFALPSVVHYLITAKYTGIGIRRECKGRDAQGYSCLLALTKVASLVAPISAFGVLKGQSIVSRKASANEVLDLSRL